jgi:HlyD family secretion protein
MASTTDLRALTVARTDSTSPVDLKLPRRWLSRVVLPLVLLGGFAGLLVWASWETLLPRKPVKVVPVLLRSEVVEATGAELFKANGWIEPRPSPVEVTAQIESMAKIKVLHAKPGQHVKAGQLLAELDDAKIALDVQAAQRKLKRKEAAVISAQADESKATTALKNAEVAITLARQEGESEIASAAADLTKAEAQRESSKLALQVEEDLLRNRVVTSDIKVRQARKLVEVAEAEVQIMQSRLARARTSVEVKTRLATAQRDAAQAEQASMTAKLQEARQEAGEVEVDVARAQLEQDRTKIRAPISGIIMQLNVRQGSLVGGKPTGQGQMESILTLYDPHLLQVRVEVPNNKFALVRYGQPAVVEVEDVLPGKRIAGVVLYDTHQANIARNSVPVKVALPDPPPTELLAGLWLTPHVMLFVPVIHHAWEQTRGLEKLRPEMIASVRFLAPPTKTKETGGQVRRLFVPKRLVQGEGTSAQVWVVDPLTQRAQQKAVTLGIAIQGDWIEVKEGLQPTDKVISSGTEGLQPGDRVQVVGEDQ